MDVYACDAGSEAKGARTGEEDQGSGETEATAPARSRSASGRETNDTFENTRAATAAASLEMYEQCAHQATNVPLPTNELNVAILIEKCKVRHLLQYMRTGKIILIDVEAAWCGN